MTCDIVNKQLPMMLYGELSFDEEESVQAHLDHCADCRTELERVRMLHQQLDAVEPELPPDLLHEARRNLRVSVAALAEMETAGRRRSSPLDSLRAIFGGWREVWKPAGALALLAVGFLGGRVAPSGVGVASLLRDPEPVVSRVRYVQPDNSGKVQIVLEEVRQRVLEGGLDDDRIQTLLLSAARESNDPGVRVETVDLLKSRTDSSEVRRALLAALQHDTNPGVRLKALEALKSSADDEDTRQVLAQVLLTDDNPGIRTQAIDLLTRKREPAIVGVLQELMERENNNYVRLKCQRALDDMNASVETF